MNDAALFAYPLTIREHHLDTFGHVNNAVYLQIFEEARWEIITSRGFGMKEIRASGQGPVILAVELKFSRELKLREQVVIHTQLVELKGKVSRLRQWILNPAGEVACEAMFTFGLFDLRSRKLLDATPEWTHALGVPS